MPRPEQPQRERTETLLTSLGQVIRAIAAGVRHEELTLGQFFTMEALANAELRSCELAERMALSRSTISTTVDALVRRGYVERREDPADRRSVRLSLTSEGERVHAAYQQRAAEESMRLLAGLAPDEREALWRGLAGLERLVGHRDTKQGDA